MKKLTLTITLVLTMLFANAQYRIGNNSYGNLLANLNDSTKVATLRNDTLYVHKPKLVHIVQESSQLRYLKWKGKTYRYRYAFYDEAYFYAGRKKGIYIY
jgi:hypothetical protein